VKALTEVIDVTAKQVDALSGATPDSVRLGRRKSVLAIPGQVRDIDAEHRLARVEVARVCREVKVACSTPTTAAAPDGRLDPHARRRGDGVRRQARDEPAGGRSLPRIC
jgi:hypothetical protein